MMRSRLLIFLFSSFFFITSCASQRMGGDSSSDSESASVEEKDITEATEDDLAEVDGATEDEYIEAELEQSENLESKPQANNETMDFEDLDEEQKVTPAPEETMAVAKPKTAELRLMHFQYSSSGDFLTLDVNQVVQYRTRFDASTKQLQLDLIGTQMSPKMSPTARASVRSRFASARAESISSDMVRILIQTKSSEDPIIQQEGGALLVMAPSGSIAPLAQSELTELPQGEGIKSRRNTPLSARSLEEFYMSGSKFYGAPLSIQVKDVDIREVINFVAEESGANIVISDDVEGKISLKLRQIPWDQALVTILRAKRLGYIRTGDVIRVSSMKMIQDDVDNARKFIESQRAIQQQNTRVIPISYANVDTLASQVRAFLTKDRGMVVVDPRTSALVISDRDEILDRLTQLIRELDVPPTQVMIEGKIVEAEERFSRSVGVRWGFTGSDRTLSPSGGAFGGPIDLKPRLSVTPLPTDAAGMLTAGFRIGTLDFLGNLDAVLALAESDSIAKILSSPRIVTMNREKAEISQIGQQISIATNADTLGNKTTRAERNQIQLNLIVTPQITADGSVIMDVEVKREFAGAVVDTQTLARPINTRSAKTKVLVRNGQTAVIGGIFQNDTTDSEQGVPGLKDVPVLGWLFKSKSRDMVKNELMIFLTPRILTLRDLSMDSRGS